MSYRITETQSRIAGQIAAIDAICQHADQLSARQRATMTKRHARIHTTRRAAKVSA